MGTSVSVDLRWNLVVLSELPETSCLQALRPSGLFRGASRLEPNHQKLRHLDPPLLMSEAAKGAHREEWQ